MDLRPGLAQLVQIVSICAEIWYHAHGIIVIDVKRAGTGYAQTEWLI